MTIDTARLRLLPYAADDLLALFDGVSEYEERLGLRAGEGLRDFVLSPDVSTAWVEQLRASTGTDQWLHGFAVVDRKTDTVIGTVGFKGAPDEHGMVEIGYGIVPGFRGLGFATEATAAGVAFAFGDARVRVVRAHTLPEPNASTRVLTKCGFTFLGAVIDPEDGTVWRWERPRESV